MKTFTNILIGLALVLVVFNMFYVNYNKPFEGESLIAIIGIIASACATLILVIFRISRNIFDKMNED